MLSSYRLFGAVFLFLVCLVANTADAVSIKSTGSRYEPGGVRYFFTVTGWLGGDSFCSDTRAVTCSLSLVGAQAPDNYYYMVSSQYYWKIKPSTNMTVVINQMSGFSIPFNGSLFVPKDSRVSNSFCITFAQGYSYPNSGGVIAPVGPCAPVIKPALKCEIKGDTTINHGDVSDAAIEGKASAITLQLACTGTSSVIATASNESPSGIKLRADGSLYSKLTIAGKAAADGVSIKVEEGSPTPISIKSTLFTKGTVEPGEFSGSTVLTISPP